MRVRILPSSPGHTTHQYLTTFLVNDDVALDAGCVGFQAEPRAQALVKSIFIGHSHADHVCSLPMLLMNTEDESDRPLAIYGSASVLDSLRTDVFNGRVWPDFLAFTRNGQPFATLTPLVAEGRVALDEVTVTPVPVNHVVPTFGFLVDDGKAAVAFSTDSAPTERLWELARATPNLKAAFIGVAFPNHLQERACKAGHLTPRLLAAELAKLPAGLRVIVVHIKVSHQATVEAEIRALGLPNVSIGDAGCEYGF